MTVFNCACDAPWPRETMEDMRVRLMRRLGYSAQATNPPPGMSELLRDFLSEAQRLVFQDYAVLRADRIFRWQMVPGERFYDFTDYEGSVIPAPTSSDITITRQHTGGILPDTKLTFKFTWVNANGETVASDIISVESDSTGGATDKYKIDWVAPEIDDCLSPITSLLIYVYNGSIYKLYFTKAVGLGTFTYTGNEGVPLPNTEPPTSNTTGNATGSRWVVDPDKIRWVATGRTDGGRLQGMVRGIGPRLLSDPIESGLPLYWDVRRCLEVWPAPTQADYLYMRTQPGLFPFAEDADYTTVDPDVIFLRALANAKAHYNKPDAGNYRDQEVILVGRHMANSHVGNRYIPSTTVDPLDPYLRPVPFTAFSG